MNAIIDLIIFFGGALFVLLGIGQFFRKKPDVRDVLLAILFIAVGVIQLQEYYSMVYNNNFLAVGTHPVQFAKFLIGPILYIYYRIYFRHDKHFKGIYTIHFFPALGSILLQVIECGYCPSSSISVHSVCNTLQNHDILFRYNWGGFILLFLYILFLFYKLVIQELIIEKKKAHYSVIIAIIAIIILLVLLLGGMGFFMKSELFSKTALIILTMFIITWFFVSMRYPELGNYLQAEIEKKQYEKEIAKSINVAAVVQKIHKLMEEEKIFKNGDITVQVLANKLSIPNHQLSDIIKKYMQSSFNSLINAYRINEAKRIIKETPDCNILSVAFAVGFNSKSAFYEAFSRQTGITPGQFKKNKKS